MRWAFSFSIILLKIGDGKFLTFIQVAIFQCMLAMLCCDLTFTKKSTWASGIEALRDDRWNLPIHTGWHGRSQCLWERGFWWADLGVAWIGRRHNLNRGCITWTYVEKSALSCSLSQGLVSVLFPSRSLDLLSPICCLVEVSLLLQDDSTFECTVFT